MRVRLIVFACVLALFSLALTSQLVSANPALEQIEQSRVAVRASLPGSEQAAPLSQIGPSVSIWPESREYTDFWTENGDTKAGAKPSSLPHLVLYEDGALTNRDRRTLHIDVLNVPVLPYQTVTVTVMAETVHRDPGQGGGVTPPGAPAPTAPRILVWHESMTVTNELGDPYHLEYPARFKHEFDSTFLSGTLPITMPTDYFQVDVRIDGVSVPGFPRDRRGDCGRTGFPEQPQARHARPASEPAGDVRSFVGVSLGRGKRGVHKAIRIPGRL